MSHDAIRKALAGNSEGDFESACTWEAVRALLADRDALAAQGAARDYGYERSANEDEIAFLVDGEEIARATYDEHGSAGMRLIETIAIALHDRTKRA